MHAEILGEGEPSYTVVAVIHGDEPCGVCVDALRESVDALREPVQMIAANERALDRGVRYPGAGLNRSFPGDPDATAVERRLVVRVLSAVADTAVLDLHSTRSCAEPFAVGGGGDHVELAAATGTAHVVEASYVGGGLLNYADGVAVERGRLGTDAAAGNAVRIAGRFLAAVDALKPPDALAVSPETRVSG